MSSNTFSNANRTRDPNVMQTFFWTVYGIFRNEEPDFIKRNSSRRSSSRTSTARTKTRSRNAPAPKVSGRVSEANCEAASRPRADMGCAADPSRPAVAHVQVGCGVQLLALRRAHSSQRTRRWNPSNAMRRKSPMSITARSWTTATASGWSQRGTARRSPAGKSGERAVFGCPVPGGSPPGFSRSEPQFFPAKYNQIARCYPWRITASCRTVGFP